MSPEAVEALQIDVKSDMAERMIPFLEAAWQAVGTDEDLAAYAGRDDLGAAVEALGAWDKRMDRHSSEAALYRVWLACAAQETLGGDLSFLFEPIESAAPQLVSKVLLLAHEEQIEVLLDGRGDEELLAALDQALTWLDEQATRRGLDALTWGDLHLATFTSPDGEVVQAAMDGDGTTVNVAHCSMWDGDALREACETSHAAVFRQVTTFDAAGTPQVRFNWPLGNDGDLDRWITGEFVTFPFSRADVEARAVETFTLE